ncbi:Zinc finger HIT domain-containing protein 1 [Mortierella sp. GBA35]|nr:Zinc finger HIT domain-containing protein 1 [Mortierella sp. AD031]KAF9106944.1 Zinc finger HIT domain-containing protein 1 [Mortierella sp. GBA35]KAG0200587.1 Zinc finger HIT domain-containing protein 1 [Mortierella sp. NVP41]
MSRKPERGAKAAPKVLDPESRRRQLRHHLDSLERDNFVALNEYEAIIATAAAAATAQGPISLTHTNLDPLGLLPPLSPAVGSIVGGVVGTVGPGAVLSTTNPGIISGGRSKKNQLNSSGASGSSSTTTGGSNFNQTAIPTSALGHRKPVLPRKPLNQLLDESGLIMLMAQHEQQQQSQHIVPNYLTANMGPSRYPQRQFCSVCGWKGVYRCNRCGMRYCDLKCQRTHNDTRCMKFTI